MTGIVMSKSPESRAPLSRSIHQAVAVRLAKVDQRYTTRRRLLVETLAASARPLTIPEMVSATPRLPQSTIYRNLTILTEVGVARRLPGTDDHGRYELAEELSGHHHHLICTRCGRVDDVPATPPLERALDEAASAVVDRRGYMLTEHRFDQLGLCPDCHSSG
jgi:Fe2+ or Zn2+ uptake regulation protein